jgi:hypothetical protein
MENVNIINSVETVSAIMVKLSQHAHKNARNVVGMVYVVLWNIVIIVLAIVASAPKCLGVEMELVIILKIVQVVQVIVAHVLQLNIVEIMFVIMVKPVIHVEQTALHALMYVGMGNAQAQSIVCHVLLIVDHAHLQQIAGMDSAIVYTNHVVYVQVIVVHVYHHIVAMGPARVVNHAAHVQLIVGHALILVAMDIVIL